MSDTTDILVREIGILRAENERLRAEMAGRETLGHVCGWTASFSACEQVLREGLNKLWIPNPKDAPFAEQIERTLKILKREIDASTNKNEVLFKAKDVMDPFVTFIQKFKAKPIGTGDAFYGIHPGTEWAAELKLSDLNELWKVYGLIPRRTESEKKS